MTGAPSTAAGCPFAVDIAEHLDQRNTSGETWKNSARRRRCVLLNGRFPWSTAEATLREPTTGRRSAPEAALFHEVLQHAERRNVGQLDLVVVDFDELLQQ